MELILKSILFYTDQELFMKQLASNNLIADKLSEHRHLALTERELAGDVLGIEGTCKTFGEQDAEHATVIPIELGGDTFRTLKAPLVSIEWLSQDVHVGQDQELLDDTDGKFRTAKQ